MTAVSVDPRLRARRVAVQREDGRRRLRRLLFAMGTIILLGSAYLIARSPLLDVDSINYVGLDQTALVAATEADGIDVGASLIGLDADAVTGRLEDLPWVEDASVSRSWTGELTITVVEREAIAAVMVEQDRWALVDATGRVLTGVVNVAPDLPKISGVAAAGEPGSLLAADADPALQIAEYLPAGLQGRVDGIYRDEIGELWISLKTGDRVLFGTDDELALKVVAMTTVIERLDTTGRTAFELDVAVPTLPIVKDLREQWRPVVAPEPTP